MVVKYSADLLQIDSLKNNDFMWGRDMLKDG
jgi:hypothetical protein